MPLACGWSKLCRRRSLKWNKVPILVCWIYYVCIRQSSWTRKKLADICFKLNVKDSHTVNYALKKLIKYGLVQSEKQGKEVFYGTTKQGQALCMAYRDVRESCLVDEYAAFDGGSGKPNAASLGEVARQLRLLSGLYDQAARSASGF